MSFAPYSRYKRCAVNWIGSLPESWEVRRLRHVCKCLDGLRVPLNASERAQRPGAIPYWGANSIVGYVDQALVEGEIVLLGEDGAPFFDKSKAVAFLSQDAIWPNNHVHVLRPSIPGTGAFIAYSLNAADYSRSIEGSTRDKLTQSAMNDIPLPWPSREEQERIVTFLDRETGGIDSLVAEQRRLMDQLQEKRQAVISHTVTKGVNPHAPMRSSGVEWLDQVPAHWGTPRIAQLFREVAEPGNDSLPILSVSIHYGVSDDEVTEEGSERKVSRSDDRSKYKRVQPGDLAYNMMRAWQGAFGTVTTEGAVSPAYVVARPRTSLETRFIERLLRTPQAIEEMRRRSRGITDFRLRLYWDEFKTIRVVLPPEAEIHGILRVVEDRDVEFERIADACEACIHLLQERRAALISAAVTGQIDVRHLAGAEAA